MIHISDLIGNFGMYQLWLSFILLVSKFGVAFHQFAILFLAPPVSYTCANNETCCDNPVFDTREFFRTIVTEWNLTCNRSWLKDLNQTVFQFGVLVGSLVFGIASDRYGRRIALLISVIIEIFTGIMASFMPEFWSFTIVRLFLGISVGGVTVVTFVLLIEYIGTIYRDITSIIFHMPFTLGHFLLAFFGYFIRDYVHFQLCISATSLILLFYICLLPESPRWYLVTNKTFKAIELMEYVAEINKLPKDSIRQQVEMFQLDFLKISRKKGTAIDLFSKPNFRNNIIIMSFTWFVSGYCYYGVSQYISNLTGNLFVNVAASGSVCFCGCIFTIPLIKLMERRTLVIACNISSSICLIIIAIITEGIGSVITGCFGILFSFMAFIVEYLYCLEMFPTSVRNSAIGISSMMARLGSMIAPFVASFRNYEKWCAPVAFGLPLMIAAFLCIFLPETKDIELPMTIEDGEALRLRPLTQFRKRASSTLENTNQYMT